MNQKILLALTCILVAAVALAFYAPALQFGFFNDDPTGHFRWMEGRSILSFFVDASGHGYYRPLSFAIWQTLHALLGRHDAFTLHLLNVLAHALNAGLVCWLGQRLAQMSGRGSGLLFGGAAGVLFAFYPFSYEAVPYIGSFVHPLVTLFILLTLALYMTWRARGGWGWFAAAHAALALAVLTQETGVIAPLLILALEGLNLSNTQYAVHSTSLPCTPRIMSHIRPALSFLAEPALFALAWWLVPKSSAEGRVFSWQAAPSNVLPFAQALVYPIAPLAWQNQVWLAIMAIAALAGLYWLARALRQARLYAFGVLIWGLAALPSILLLDPAYVTGSPRLFYLGSVGAALVWALPVQIPHLKYTISNTPYQNHVLPLRVTYYVLRIACYVLPLTFYVLLFAFCLFPYTRCQLRYQGYAGEIGQMMAAAARQASEGEITWVNAPYFFGSRGTGTACPRPFAFAPSGAVAIPPYADARDFAFYNGGADLPARAETFDAYAPGWATHGQPIDAAGLRAALASSRVFVFDLLGWRFHDLSALWQLNSTRPITPLAILGGAIQLQQSSSAETQAGTVVTLTWYVVDAPGRDYQVFAQLLDTEGKLAAQHDGAPAQGLAPTQLWQAGDRIVDVHVIPAPRNAGRLIVGMYDPATGTRLEAIGPDGVRLPDDAIALQR